MSIINADVVEGLVLVLDAQGNVQITHDRLNLQAKPTVTLNLSNEIQNEDLVAGTIEKDKLNDNIADEIPTGIATVAAESANDVDVSVQFQDINASSLSRVMATQCWISDTSGAAPAALPSGGAPTIVSSQGVIIEALTASAPGTYLSNSSGLLVLRFTEAGALTKFFNMIIGNEFIAGSQALTWT